MKTVLIPLIGALTLGTALPAIAGPDWQLIEQARKAKQARLQQGATAAQSAGSSGAGTLQQDEMRRNQMMKDCMDMMKKAS